MLAEALAAILIEAIEGIFYNGSETDPIRRKTAQGFRLAAPTLLDYEVSSVCLKKIRLHPEHRGALLSAYRLLPRLPVDRYRADAEATIQLAEETGLSVYDACYLWLARNLRAELMTLDRRLASASKRISR